MFRPSKIVSGGQTGVDRAALDVAIELGIDHGGWCPRGRKAEDGRIADRYQLRETTSRKYADRTEQNVLDSDATLILHRGQLAGGAELTRKLAEQHEKPLLLVDLQQTDPAAAIGPWLTETTPATLNIAGPRESTSPGVYKAARRLLLNLWT